MLTRFARNMNMGVSGTSHSNKQIDATKQMQEMINKPNTPKDWINYLINQSIINPMIINQLKKVQIGEACQCGCNGFAVYIPVDHDGLSSKFINTVFEFSIETSDGANIDILLHTNNLGQLRYIDIETATANSIPVPNNILIGATIQAPQKSAI
mgnify:CR=1 FL=1